MSIGQADDTVELANKAVKDNAFDPADGLAENTGSRIGSQFRYDIPNR